MRKRTLIAGLLLLFMGIASTVSLIFLEKSTESLTNGLEELAALSERGAFQKAKAKAKYLTDEFEKYESIYLLTIKSTFLEDIEEQLTALESYADHEDAVHLTAEAKEVASKIQHIWKTERPNLINIF